MMQLPYSKEVSVLSGFNCCCVVNREVRRGINQFQSRSYSLPVPLWHFKSLSYFDLVFLLSCLCPTSCYNLVQTLLITPLFFFFALPTHSYGEDKYTSILLKQNVKKKKNLGKENGTNFPTNQAAFNMSTLFLVC